MFSLDEQEMDTRLESARVILHNYNPEYHLSPPPSPPPPLSNEVVHHSRSLHILCYAHILISIAWLCSAIFAFGCMVFYPSGVLGLTHVIAGMFLILSMRDRLNTRYVRPVVLLCLELVGLGPIGIYGWLLLRDLNPSRLKLLDPFGLQVATRLWSSEYTVTICVLVLLSITALVHLMGTIVAIYKLYENCKHRRHDNYDPDLIELNESTATIHPYYPRMRRHYHHRSQDTPNNTRL